MKPTDQNLKTLIVNHKKSIFWAFCITTVLVSGLSIFTLKINSELNILPLIIEARNHPEPQRTPDTFSEDFSSNASQGKLIYRGDSSFTFRYTKTPRKGHSFTGAYFPLENLSIDFSQYDRIEISVQTNKARRIPLNLSVQNKLETHQYVRNFIEVKKGQNSYSLKLKDFFTPTSWYDRNHVAQIEIPKQDFSKIEAISFESCHLLPDNIEDQYTVTRLYLKKNLNWTYLIIITVIILLISSLRVVLYGVVKKEKEVIHIPIKPVEFEKKDQEIENILVFLSENYNNPNLTLTDLSDEFGKPNNEISKKIKERTEKTFPQYINFLRVEEAKRILSGNDYKTIAEVGYLVGFNSPSNFIRVFKGEVGVSPKSFSES